MSGATWEIGTNEDCISWRGALVHGSDLAEWFAPWAECITDDLDTDDEADAALAALIAAVRDAALLAQIRQIVADEKAAPFDPSRNSPADALDAIASLLGEPS